MNRKGFTLIELIAVIVVLGIILVIAAPNISNAYKNSKLKSEEIFVDRLSEVIDSYVKLNSDEISFTKYLDDATKVGQEGNVIVYKGKIEDNGNTRNIVIQDIINDKLISQEDYVNAGNKDVSCSPNAQIEIYRDSDYVYCYKMSKYELDCLTDEYRDTLKIPATETEEEQDIIYAIDTCIWEEAN